MPVFRVALDERMPDGRPKLINFDCAFETLDALQAALVKDELVTGTQLFTRAADEPGVLEVVNDRPFMLSRRAVYAIHFPTKRFVRFEVEQ
jgi:hypothetical protein